jgi:hypothetical protein
MGAPSATPSGKPLMLQKIFAPALDGEQKPIYFAPEGHHVRRRS